MEEFFEKQVFCDQKIKVCNKEDSIILEIHQIILSSKSPVFYNIFMKKNWGNEKIITIETQVPLKLFKDFISLFYTENYTKIEGDTCITFLLLSNEYQVSSLIPVCINRVCENLKIDNCIEIWSC